MILVGIVFKQFANVCIFIIGALNYPNINYSKEEYIVIKKQSRIVGLVICFIIIFLKVLHASVGTIMYMEYAVIVTFFAAQILPVDVGRAIRYW